MNRPTLLLLILLLIGFRSYAQSDSTYILDLQQCVNIALENNLDVRNSLLEMENSQIKLAQSRMERLPSANLNASSGFNWGRSVDPTSNEYINQRIQYSSFSGSAGVVLFNWFNIINTIRQNRTQLSASEYSVENKKNDVTLNVLSYYLNVILNKELLNNASYVLKSSEEQLNRTKRLVASGAAPRSDELELVSQVATGEVDLINAQNDLNLALLNLKQSLLIPAAQEVQLVIPQLDSISPAAIRDAEDIYQVAIAEMPEIRSAEMSVRSAEYGVKVANAGYTPTLSLNGSISSNYSDAYYDYSSSGAVVDVPFGEQIDRNLSQSLYLNLSIPIFNNFSAKSSVQYAKVSLQQAEITLLQQKNTLRQTIESAYNDAYSASKVYGASVKQVEALEETFRSIENQYNLGASNFTDYQVASNNLYGAKSDLVRAKFDFIFKLKILDFYQGKTISL